MKFFPHSKCYVRINVLGYVLLSFRLCLHYEPLNVGFVVFLYKLDVWMLQPFIIPQFKFTKSEHYPKCIAIHKVFGTKSEDSRVCWQFPCHCFSFLTIPDFSWCNVQEAEVKGKPRVDGNEAIPLFLSLPVHSHGSVRGPLFPYSLQSPREKLMTWWGESAKFKSKTSGMDFGTGNQRISRLPHLFLVMCSGIF